MSDQRSDICRDDDIGIIVPQGFSMHGIDVSNHQGRIDWRTVKNVKPASNAMYFAFIKATEGLNDIDKRFKENWDSAKAAGILRGAYHFFLATKSGKEQAVQFIKQVQLVKDDLPPVLDIEKLYRVKPAIMRKRIQEWLDTIETHYGMKPIIYTNAHFYKKYLGTVFNKYPLWVAHYFEMAKPAIDRSWDFWQYSESGRVNGIQKKVDCNLFNGDSVRIKYLLK